MSLDKLTPVEKEKLAEFKKRVEPLLTKDAYKEDHFLIRYILARDLDLDKAEEMLKKSIEWRKEFGADDIMERVVMPEKFRKRFMMAYCGEDADGHPILLFPSGRHDHRFLLEEEGMEKSFQYSIVWMEMVMKMLADARAKTGKPVFQIHEVVDMEGYSIRQMSYKPGMDYMAKMQTMFDENYPEIIKSIMIINTPRIFPILFNLFKPLMNKHMLDKFQVYGSKSQDWVEEFKQKKFPLDNFPPRWGGTLKGDDEFCSQEKFWVDSPIPLRYFKEIDGEDEEGFMTIKVAAREKFSLDIIVEEKGTKLDWKFSTEVHDIAFGVTFELPGAEDIPVGRVPSNKKEQEGSVICGAPGTCTFTFDNRYSLTTAKTLRYKIEMIVPTK